MSDRDVALVSELQSYLHMVTAEAAPPGLEQRVLGRTQWSNSAPRRWIAVATGLLIAGVVAGVIGVSLSVHRAAPDPGARYGYPVAHPSERDEASINLQDREHGPFYLVRRGMTHGREWSVYITQVLDPKEGVLTCIEAPKLGTGRGCRGITKVGLICGTPLDTAINGSGDLETIHGESTLDVATVRATFPDGRTLTTDTIAVPASFKDVNFRYFIFVIDVPPDGSREQLYLPRVEGFDSTGKLVKGPVC